MKIDYLASRKKLVRVRTVDDVCELASAILGRAGLSPPIVASD